MGEMAVDMQEVCDNMFLPLPGIPPILITKTEGVFFYPGYWEDEQGRGDHIMIAPPFIITEEQIDECIRVLRETLEESQDMYLARPG